MSQGSNYDGSRRAIPLPAAAMLAAALGAAGCNGGGHRGESLSCLPLAPLLVEDVFIRATDQKTLVVEWNGPASVWEPELET